MKATGIKARREKLPDSAHILRALQKGPEKSASHYRKASIAYKKRCKYLKSTKKTKNVSLGFSLVKRARFEKSQNCLFYGHSSKF